MSLLDIFPDLTGLSLVFEFMPHTLYSKLRDESNPLSRTVVKSYTRMLLLGIKYMHSFEIMHRVKWFPSACVIHMWHEQYIRFNLQDIKPANLLIDHNDVLKISDFGLSRIFSNDEDRSYSPQVESSRVLSVK